jgi:type IV pilus assembly protein PilB
MELRLGQILVQEGVLTEHQLSEALAEQAQTGEPLGLICERCFSVPPQQVEQAWATQYVGLTREIDPEVEFFEQSALDLVTRRQAWQFHILPIRFDSRELMIATTREDLPRALRFATNVIGVPVYFVITDAHRLGVALSRHYPLPGMDTDSVGMLQVRQWMACARTQPG